jgi:organic radical activating enzyme
MIDINKLCVQPWMHLASFNNGQVPLCCVAQPEQGINLNTQTPIQIWNSQQFKTARLQFLAGEQPPQCSACWREEAAGVKSHRQIENTMWSRILGPEYLQELIASTGEDGTLDRNPITLDLRIGNTCNLQCVMCRPHDSSRWLADSRKLAQSLTSPGARGDWEYKATSIKSTDCFDWFSRLETQNALGEFMGDIQRIVFGGGEPLMLKEHLEFITRLVESGHAGNITLGYHTNGTQLTERFIELWSHFKAVELMISVDDWGQRNDYVRYPSSWSTLLANLDRLDNTADNIKVNILATVHAMNIYNLPEFAQQVLDRGWSKIGSRNHGLFFVGTTHWPQYMSTQVLPATIKDQVASHWAKFPAIMEHPQWRNRIHQQLEFMLSRDESSRFPDLVDYIDRLDDIRPIKFKDLYSEYYQLLRGTQ